MPGRLDGKVCIITGATSGIGEKSVEIFVSEGATVVFSGRRVEEGAAVAENTGADFYQCDVTVEAEVAGLITSTHENYGRIDCLFANAGGPGPTGGIATIDADAFNDCIAVNLNSVHTPSLPNPALAQPAGQRLPTCLPKTAGNPQHQSQRPRLTDGCPSRRCCTA